MDAVGQATGEGPTTGGRQQREGEAPAELGAALVRQEPHPRVLRRAAM